jgi:hypothetical protein
LYQEVAMRRVLGVVAMAAAFAACGGDEGTGQDQGLPDFAVNHDMAVQHDLQTDDAGPPLGTAQLTLADVSGTFYTDNGAGGERAVPFMHLLVAQQSFPHFAGNPQYVDPGFSSSAGTLHGCTANRYDLAGGVLPNPDEDVGLVSYTGYETAMFSATPAVPTGAPPPVPDTILCAWGGAALPFYGCQFHTTSDAGLAAAEGLSPTSVGFPPVPAALLGGSCLPGMTSHNVGVTVCEQHPFHIDGSTAITQNVQGGGTYGAQTNKRVPSTGGLANGATIVLVNGAAPANPDDPFGGVVLDGSTDLVVKWSCDGSATPGAGCPTGAAGLTDVLGLLAIASTNDRKAFALTPQYGSAQCAEQLGSASATVTLTTAAQQRLLMGQTGGSVFVAAVRLKASATVTNGHFVFLTAGAGNFGLIAH